jgi:hypothetical protein
MVLSLKTAKLFELKKATEQLQTPLDRHIEPKMCLHIGIFDLPHVFLLSLIKYRRIISMKKHSKFLTRNEATIKSLLQ